MLTPSPLRRKALRPADSDTSVDGELGLETPIDAEDIFGGSPYRPTAPLRSFDAHLRSSARFGGMEEDEDDDDDDERVFLSTPARHSTPGRPKRTSTARLRTPVNSSSRPRPHSTVEPTPLPAAFASARTPARRTPLRVNTQTTGVKRKSTELNFLPTPQAKGALTPLSVTKPGGESSFDRLAPLPLPAPKFKRRDEPELFLGRANTMDSLRIGNASFDVDDEPIDVSPDGHIAKRRAKSRPLSQDLPGGTVAFPSAAEARTRTLSNESSSSKSNHGTGSVRPTRQRLSHASNVSSRSRTKSGAQGLSRAQTIAAATPGRPIARRLESNGSATLFFGPAIPRSSTPARRRRSPVPQDSAQRQFARHSYAGPSASPVPFGPGRSSSPSLPDDEPMGEISDEDAARSMPDVSMIADMDEDDNLAGMDEEDLFFASSSFRSNGDEGTGADSSADDSFGWGSAPAHASTFSINVTASTPSPRKPVKAMLEKKFKPRDSGIGLTDDEDAAPRLGLRAPVIPSATRGFGIGRSGSVSIMAPPPMVPSSSASTTASSDLDALVTPGFGPSASSGWPSFASSSTSTSSDLLSLLSADSENAMDTFIGRTLASAQAQVPSAPGAGEPKRAAPGTPQKRARAQDRAWHSAFATGKVGFDYSQDDVEGDVEGDEGGKKKKKPRKSLPAAFPSLSMGMGKAKPKLTLPGVRKNANAGARVGESDLDSDSESPGKRASGKYAGIGLGRPQRPGAAWLLRRSSSGAISTASGESSWPATPTAATAGGKSGWQLPPPRIPPASPATQSRLPSRLSPASTRTASSSSTSTATASPLGSRLLQINPHNSARLGASPLKSSSSNNQRTATLPPPVTVTKTNVRRGGRPSLPAMPLSSDARPGRFEAEFVEAGEIGSGEFGKVMRVKLKIPSPCAGDEESEWAVKRSKRFEGARHRLRVREEVDVLQHLRRAYTGHGKWHPNVLGIVDAWEEDEALFIRTELCALGSFSRFLWEFGRRFERLDEGRVWKIAADLSCGLAFVHASGVLHLDLKPANIFLTAEGRFKLGDFGMATLWPRAGTPAPLPGEGAERPPGFEREGDKCYLAPEVLQGRYGPAADIFSLGITLLETAANIVVPDQGEQWHRLRQDDLSGVDLAGSSAALVGLLGALLRADPFARPDAAAVCAHPAVRRAKAAMELAGPGAGSPLAPVPPGFLTHVLGELEEEGEEEPMML
ncbi:unnamed protein product [Peniophora sp. CBMAI 1063]|nr:unnamed protein product [Peniophora sp. CBMAI 1063]